MSQPPLVPNQLPAENYSRNLLTFGIEHEMIVGTACLPQNLRRRHGAELEQLGPGLVPYDPDGWMTGIRYIHDLVRDFFSQVFSNPNNQNQMLPTTWVVDDYEDNGFTINSSNVKAGNKYERWNIIWEELDPVQYADLPSRIRANEVSRDPNFDPMSFSAGQYGYNRMVGGMELVSPIYAYAEIDNLCADFNLFLRAIEACYYTYTAIDRRFQRLALHVHVGVGYGNCFSVPTVKNIMAIVSLFEEVLDQVHPINRTELDLRTPNMGNRVFYNVFGSLPSLRRSSHRHVFEDEAFFDGLMQLGNDYLAPIYAYLRTANTQGGFVGGKPRVKIDLEKGTLEFRQHLATNDTNDIKEWIGMITLIIDRAHEYLDDMTTFRAILCDPRRNDLSFFLIDFLRMHEEPNGQQSVHYWLQREARFSIEKAAWGVRYLDFPGMGAIPEAAEWQLPVDNDSVPEVA